MILDEGKSGRQESYVTAACVSSSCLCQLVLLSESTEDRGNQRGGGREVDLGITVVQTGVLRKGESQRANRENVKTDFSVTFG